MSLSRLLFVAVALCLSLAASQRASAAQQSPGSVTSTAQSGGITAYSIGEVTIYEDPKPDRKTKQLGAAMGRFRNLAMQQATATVDAPIYMFDVDIFGPTSPKGGFYQLFVEEDPDLETVCEVRPGLSLGGAVTHASSSKSKVEAETRQLTANDRALLEPICRGLALPLSSLRTRRGASRGDAEDLTIYDFLARQNNMVIMMIFPAERFGREIDLELARYYWAGVLTLRYMPIPTDADLQSDPDAFAEMSDMETGGSLHFSKQVPPSLLSGEGLNAYPAQARREFGERIAKLDAEWLKYLSHATLTIRGERRPLMRGGQPATFLRKFSAAEIGSPAFWLSANDHGRAVELVGCIAGRFMDDAGYGDWDDQPHAERCSREETAPGD